MNRSLSTFTTVSFIAAAVALSPAIAFCEEDALSGDIGVGVSNSSATVNGSSSSTAVVPYLNFEYKRWFARIDTFGVKTLPIGYGHLELVGQYREDDYTSSLAQRRQSSAPLGLGTLQITPIGAFGINMLHDFGKSGGNLVQARYLAQLPFGRVTVYPEVGAEYQTSAYVRYYYGTSGADAIAPTANYRPGAAFNPYIGALIEARITDKWYLNAYLRRSNLDTAITKSPLSSRDHRDSALLSLTYRY